MSEYLRQEGSDIIFAITMIDNNGDAITAGQTVELKALRLSDNMWWNDGTADFDLAAEPAFFSAPQVGSTGIYKYNFLGSFDYTKLNYRLHIKTVGVVPFNFSKEEQVVPNEGLGLIASAMSSGNIKADLRAADGLSNIDGMTFAYIYSIVAAMVNGRFKRDVPSAGKITFYERDNATPLTVVSVTTDERTRDS